MLTTLLSLLLVVTSVHCSGPLPEYMVGDYVLETSEGFNNYMYEVGVDWFTRKVGITSFFLIFYNCQLFR